MLAENHFHFVAILRFTQKDIPVTNARYIFCVVGRVELQNRQVRPASGLMSTSTLTQPFWYNYSNTTVTAVI